jgi:hypothetical protein
MKKIFVITPIGEKGSEEYIKFDSIFKTMIIPSVHDVDNNLEIIKADDIHRNPQND